eukprot:TRINITY_DN35255_c0_g1_i1.p2 TRINITY_DN35255_c0_g1~~TRINITY_DN35255_c0_g1_i1.p2  ORF type:complete len:189 (-),score=15.39 TRINITY_DN35255_c0_g1_i1:1118-1684(-)
MASSSQRPWRRCGTVWFDDLASFCGSISEIMSTAGAAISTFSDPIYGMFGDSRGIAVEPAGDTLTTWAPLQSSRGDSTDDVSERELSDALPAATVENFLLLPAGRPAESLRLPPALGVRCVLDSHAMIAALLEHAAAAYETVAEQHAALLYASPTLPRHPHTHTHTHTTLLRRGWTLSLTCCEPLILR